MLFLGGCITLRTAYQNPKEHGMEVRGGWKMFCIFKRCYVQGGILIACYCRSQGREHSSYLPGILVIQVFTGIQYIEIR